MRPVASFLCAFFTLAASAVAAPTDEAQQILKDTGVQTGFIVHVGCGDGALTAALRTNDGIQVHGLDRDADNVRAAREALRKTGDYGAVSAAQWDGRALPYIDSLVNLLVVEDKGELTESEMLRVLTPGGVAYVKSADGWTKTVKPLPKNTDEWTHYLHGPDGNAVAHDTAVGPPRHMQWLGSPRWSRHHDRMASMSALVTADGRLFYIMDEGSRVSIQLPPKWKLICRDAYNGVVLWKRDIEEWQSHLWPLKSGPTQLARRLLTDGKRVYVTRGITAPLECIDAATGETIFEYDATAGTEEVVLHGETLVAMVNPGEPQFGKFLPQNGTVGDQALIRNTWRWNEQPRVLKAINAPSGSILWEKETKVAPITVTANGERVVYHDGERLVALDQRTGEELWKTEPISRREAVTANFGPRLIQYEDVVLFAGGDRKMHAVDAKTGKTLWSADHGASGYQSPEDLVVMQGLVWATETTSGRQSGVYTGRDPRTGEVKVEFPPNVDTYWFHHRCYIAKATDRFLIPSRTGIEFVDPKEKDWMTHHWVRGGCLYGVLPANGLLYAAPNNCFCYPEAKLYGFNALAPASETRSLPETIDDADRLHREPGFNMPVMIFDRDDSQDWPTYRHDNSRSGHSDTGLPAELDAAWETKLSGQLSAVTVANGRVFVSQIDQHTVYALDEKTGEIIWNYTVGGRVDSPPTYHYGRLVFGSADGWVYCLEALTGQLRWKFRAAPVDRRLMAFEQLESVWPVHGSVLVEDDAVWCVAGRSNFLDGGLRLLKLDLTTGKKLLEEVFDANDPKTGENLQARLQTLQMPVGLPDILSSDGESLFMRSQEITKEGERIDIGPHSGDAPTQGSVQRGETAHLFSPSGFLDDTWFHRSYWVFGRSFAGGHNGYYQAGKFAPSGRLLAFDDEHVYGYGRKPEYYRWTTTLEHHLFAAPKMPPEVKAPAAGNRPRAAGGSMVSVDPNERLDPTGKAFAVEAWVKTDKPNGTVLAQGGPAVGYALVLRQGKPSFTVRETTEKATTISGQQRIGTDWTHLAAVLSPDKRMRLFVNGKEVAAGVAPALVPSFPKQGLSIAADSGSPVGDYQAPFALAAMIDEVRVYHGAVTPAEVRDHFENPGSADAAAADIVMAMPFDDGTGADVSGAKNHGDLTDATGAPGKLGKALAFTGRARGGNANAGAFHVQHEWTRDVPLFARAMVLADDALLVAGPPDIVDEVESFEKLRTGDPEIESTLARQDAALEGASGGTLLRVSLADGQTAATHKTDWLPVWDGMAAANGHLYVATTDGRVICLGE
jgi:outer membrane protein assembly factor BamB